jgi:hypothetical protein
MQPACYVAMTKDAAQRGMRTFYEAVNLEWCNDTVTERRKKLKSDNRRIHEHIGVVLQMDGLSLLDAPKFRGRDSVFYIVV